MSLKVKNSKTVILYGGEDLLSRSIEIFLSSREEWEVIRISDQQTVSGFVGEVAKANPDAVIICQGDDPNQPDFSLQLLEGHPELKVITISLEDNLMSVLNKKKVLIREVPDLLSVIES